MARQGERAAIYEKIGEVYCSPPGLEYKKSDCLEKASFVCHHCNSPLCRNCVVLVPDDEFPVFLEEGSTTPTYFYASNFIKIILAILIFPLVHLISGIITIPNIPSQYLSLDYYSLTLKVPLNTPLQITLNFMLLILVALVLSAITSLCCTYVKIEEKADGSKVLKKYVRQNLTAAHCQYCYEKYHKGTTLKVTSKIVAAVLGLIALWLIVMGYFSGVIDLTYPLIIAMISSLIGKVLKLTQPIKIEPEIY